MSEHQQREEPGVADPTVTDADSIEPTNTDSDTTTNNAVADIRRNASTDDTARTETEQADHSDRHFMNIIEALIFAADEPLTFRQIKTILEEGKATDRNVQRDKRSTPPLKEGRKGTSFTINRFRSLVAELNQEYEQHNRAFRIVEIAGGYSFQTVPEYGTWIGRLFAARSRRRLTPSALETLAIIAFRQPISKPAIESIRGVNADHVIKTLLEKELITIVGREDTVGRPLLYGTTKTFLVHFGLASLDDLPKPREIEELFREGDVPDTMDADPANEGSGNPAEESIPRETSADDHGDSGHPFFESPTVNVGITLDESRELQDETNRSGSSLNDEEVNRNSQTATDEETDAEEENAE